MRVLASAYACEPAFGSEPGVGWNWVCQLSRFHEVWVLTRKNNRDRIEAQLSMRPMPSVHWVYLDLPAWLMFWKRGPRGARLYYYLWQIAAYFRARRLHRAVRFEVVHHLTFVNYWMPSFLALLNVPFIWGPVGGGESAPRGFIQEFGIRARLYESARNLARWSGQLDPFVRITARRARRTFCTTEQTLLRVKELGASQPTLFSESGLSSEEQEALARRDRGRHPEFTVISMGRLLHWKGFELGLRGFAAFCAATGADAIYEIIGEGPEAARLKSLAQSLGINERVRLLGRLERGAALDRLARADVLLHPSLHDSGGWVCLEAMATNVPVVCLDLGGPAVRVTDETGIKIQAESPRQTVQDIAGALCRLHSDPEMRRQLGRRGAERVRRVFDWDVKGTWMRNVYEGIHVEGR